jgi:hypothetical protein
MSQRLLDSDSQQGRTAEDTPETTGQAKIVGDDPLRLVIHQLGIHYGDPSPYKGRYPCGSLVLDGAWYYGTYTLDDLHGACGNWCTLGPFVGFRHSLDYGLTWIDTPHTPASPLFGESAQGGARVKIGAPHFVDFGRNMQHSPDGKAYLVAHGANGPDGWANWIAGDAVYLLRVTPSVSTINDPMAYEYFAGRDAEGRPLWSHDFAAIQPLLTWHRQLGCVTVTYNAPLDRYLMCVSRPADGFSSLGAYDTIILESSSITGPWSLVHYLHGFGPEAYFVNIPSKFISADGRTAWLCYSANFAQLVPGEEPITEGGAPPGSQYSLCLQEFSIDMD